MLRLKYFAIVALVTIAAIIIIYPSAAQAGTYVWQSCSGASQDPVNAPDPSSWSPVANGSGWSLNSSGCKSVGGLGILFDSAWGNKGRLFYSNTGPMNSGNYWAGFSLHAPGGTVFSSLSWRQRILTTGGGNKCVLATSNIFSGAYTLAQNCFGPSTNWQDSGWVSRSANVSAAYNRDLLLVGACIVAYGNCSVYSAGNQTTGNALHTAFDQINAVLSDTTAPAMSGISRPGDGAWIRGGWNTTWSASDAMGIKTHRFLVDDAVGDSNSFCDIPWYGNYYGTSSQPCPNPGAEDYSNADFSIDTSAYSDATHTLKLQSSDATDVWASSQSTIKTDNSPPDPPSFGVGITEGAWVSSSSSNFEFSAQDTQSGINSYQCQVDDGSFSACQSPKTLTLPDGPHNICVQAFNNSSDSDGVLNSSEGCTSFQIDRVTPTTTMNRPAGNIAQAGTFVSGSVVPGESGLREIVFEARQAGQPNWQTLCDLTESQNTLYSCEIDGVSLNIGDTYNLRMKSTSNSGLSSTSQTYDAVVLPDTAESGSLPANSNLPTIEGVLSPDETLTSTTGNWTGDPTFSYLWQTSDSGSGDWITASGDGYNTSSYVVPLGDMGKWLRVQVTGTNNSGGTVALSLTRGRVSVLPSALEAPALIGTAEVGSMISVSDGLWIGNPVPTMSYQWQVSVNGNDWLDANGAGNATNGYLPQISDSGHYLRVVVSGNNWGGTVQEFSNISEAVGMSPSAQNPVIEGTATVASRLNVTQPIIEGSPNPDLNYTWQSSSDNLNWNDIGVGNNYLLTAAESAKHVRIKLTLDNSFGSSTVYSQSVLVETITENTAPPTIGASAKVAVAILANAGTWTGSPSLTYQWQISSNGTNWTNANGVIDTSLSYSPVHLDAGSILRLKVTANGTTVAHSNSLTVNESPSLGEVTLSGNARIGATLTASSGSWRGYPSPTFTYQWQTSTDGFSFSDISGAESLSYLIKEADIGNYLRLKVTGSNNQGSADIYSPISRIVSRIPTNDTPPTISNQKVLGQTITSVSDGAWTSYPDPNFTYQWERCDLACAPIVSETGASYQLARADVGHKIKLTVTADNQFDQVKASSDQSATIEGVAANTSLPVIEGVAIIGGNLHVTDGLWNAWPDPSYSYDWQSCQGETCSAIANQDSSSYSPTLEDNGKTIKASVTATNTHGQTTVTSQASVAVHVTASPPINNTLPAISGVAETGQTYTSVNGNWSSDFEISYSYNWQRCDISGCQTIIGAIQNSYLTDDADAGKEIRLKVTATNADGATEASSAKSATIVQTKPTNQSAPVISGSKTVTSVLTVNNGTWLGFGNSYQTEWQRCNPSCATISAGQQYTLTTADLGANIKAIVTASNAHGSNSASSQPFGPVEAASVPPGGDTPGGGLPGGDTPGGGLPGGDTPGGGLPGGDTPGGGLPGGDTPGGGVCMGTSAISASKASVAGSKISFKAVPASWSQTTMRLQVQASKPLSFSWMYDNKIIATISKSKSSKASLPAKTIGQHYLVLTAKSGKKIIKIKKTIIVLLCPQSKSLLPAIKTINTKVGNGKFSIIIAKNYSANKPGLWLLKGRGSAVWKLDGKIISKKNSTLISPETLKIGSHKISLKITNKKKSKTIIIAINAQ